MKCELRSNIMDKCPEEFVSELKEFIDEVESKINEVQHLLDIKSIQDLTYISDASDILNDLAESLY